MRKGVLVGRLTGLVVGGTSADLMLGMGRRLGIPTCGVSRRWGSDGGHGGLSCGGVGVGVLFSKSPRGRPAGLLGTGGGESPKIFEARIWLAFCALWIRVGLVGLLVWVLEAGFASGAGTG